MPTNRPKAALVVCEQRGTVYFEAKFRYAGRQVKRRIGPAWLERDETTGGWRRHKGRTPDGWYDERAAHVAADRLVADYVTEALEAERLAAERTRRGVTFREVALAYLRWLEDVKGAKPSTIRNHRSVLADPGTPYRRGRGELQGFVISAIGHRPAADVTTSEIERMLANIRASGASPRTVNKYRAVVSAAFNFGMRETTFGLPSNPAAAADKRREPPRATLEYYSPEEIEALARALATGLHRPVESDYAGAKAEDARDAELVRVAAYAGLRQGELLALRWRDVDFAGHALTVERALSDGVISSTKSGLARRVPLPDQAAGALDRLSQRADFTAPDDFVFCNALGRTLDDSALRRRFGRARAAANLRPLRFHDLRHTYGSLLAAAGVDLVQIQAAMGHGSLSTTSRYLHARPASEQAQRFTQAFQPRGPREPVTQALSRDIGHAASAVSRGN